MKEKRMIADGWMVVAHVRGPAVINILLLLLFIIYLLLLLFMFILEH